MSTTMPMLKSITLRNLATISDTSLEFQKGLNVLTGETGSGKSILVDGLMLATGRRADTSMVRPGSKTASVEAVFQDELGEDTIVRREISAKGRSRIFIDDSLATLDEVKGAVQGFVELHSQRSTPVLLKSWKQLELVDQFAGCTDLRIRFSGMFREMKQLKSTIASLEETLEGSMKGREILLHEKKLFDSLTPSESDYRSLVEEEASIRRAAEHSALFQETAELLHGDDGVSSRLNRVLTGIRKSSPDSTVLIELLEQASISVEEAYTMVLDRISIGEDAPVRIAEIEERLDQYSALIARFGGTVQAMLDSGEQLDEKLRIQEETEEVLAATKQQLASLSKSMLETAAELTSVRIPAAEKLAAQAVEEMKRLNMPWADFSVQITEPAGSAEVSGEHLGAAGAEGISFMFSANRGIPCEPLESVASGGELSRVALALALVLADSGTAATLIFDEIDSGTGGETAHMLAESLVRASVSRQIIVISHLAQVASKAHRHMAVEKDYQHGMPVTSVRHLDDQSSRIDELSRLLGGGHGARDHAAKLIGGKQ